MQKIYYGEQTQKALRNFPFSSGPVSCELIYAIAEIKKAAAIANFKAGNLDNNRKIAIIRACGEILDGEMNEQFKLPALQGGAGTSIHMNVNEVIASRATEILQAGGKDLVVHSIDHVNHSQSTNDVLPSALKIVAVKLTNGLLKVLDGVVAAFEKKSQEFQKVSKLGRTHLQDAVPTTLGAEFLAYAEIINRDKKRLQQNLSFLLELNLGGTAIGNSINVKPKYLHYVYQELKMVTKLPFKPAKNLMAQTSSQADFVSLSQSLTLLTMDASKIANDLRLLASGPKGGLGEIVFEELQKGSSIMPGKVNPVLPEAVNQLYFWVSGGDLSIQHAAQASQLELGVMGPTIADSLILSLKLTAEVLQKFAADCVLRIKANKSRCKELLENSTAYATLLNPYLGYDKVAELVKKSVESNRTIRDLVLEQKLMSNKEFEVIVNSFKA
jgi:aspartate ammonia-lyase